MEHPESDLKYMILFKAIDEKNEIDEQKLLRKNPTLLPAQISNLKAHLYREVLLSIQRLESKNHPEIQISEMMDQARLLYDRCLYNDCLSMIDKAKKKASSNDSFLLLLELLELEKLAVSRSGVSHSAKRVNQIISETEKTANAIRNINSFSNLSLLLTNYYQQSGFIRNKRELDKIKKLFFSSLPHYKETELSFHELLYLYQSFIGYSFFVQDLKNGLHYASQLVRLFDSHPEMKIRRTEMYIKALNSLLVVQNKLYLYKDFMDTHRKLVALKRNKPLRLTDNISLHLFKAIYIHEINRHFMLGEFRSGTKIVLKLEKELNDFIPKLDTHTVLIFYYKIASLYVGAGNYKIALKWLNKIFQAEEPDLREDIHAFARILRLICYFELQDDEMVDSAIRSAYRFLLQNRNFAKYHLLIIRFLKNLKKGAKPEEIIRQFKDLKSKMMLLTNDPFEKRAFLYFDMISWLESKIENKSIQDIIKLKAQKRIQQA